MKHGVIDTCLISSSTVNPVPDSKWYRFKSRSVSKEHLEMYALSRKYMLSDFQKIPKSLYTRLMKVCPLCFYMQCACSKTKSNKHSDTVSCRNCNISFLPRENKFKEFLRKIDKIKFFCKDCRFNTERVLSNYIKQINLKKTLINTVAKKGVYKLIENFKYRLKVEGTGQIFPASFLWKNSQLLTENLIKMLRSNLSYKPTGKTQSQRKKKHNKSPSREITLDIKPDAILYIGRGKSNCFRKSLLNKRSFNSSRSVIVPAPFLKGNEIILNTKIWSRLGFPKYVLVVRHPVLDTRAYCFFKVVGVSLSPVLQIGSASKSSLSFDYDGDQLNIFAIKRYSTFLECYHLINPQHSFVSMNEPRLNFNHDDIECLFNFFKITTNEVQKFLITSYMLHESEKTFKTFEELRASLGNVNDLVKSTVSYELFRAILETFLVHKIDPVEFKAFCSSNNFISNCIFTRYIQSSNSTSWKYEHLYQMINYLKGLDKIQYILEALQCRTALSKIGVETTGYATHKLSYSLPELWLNKEYNVYYGRDQLAYRGLRRLSTPITSYKVLKMYSLYRLIKRIC